jgi:type VI secretion system protein ImpH
MATQERESSSPLKERLFKESYRFSFFKAVNLLETLEVGKKPVGSTLNPSEEAVHFSVKPGFTFPPSDISNLSQGDRNGPARMEVAFMGLLGPSGVLPYWYNELAVDRVREKDFALTAFLDIFHHRLISLFYLAWKRYRFPENYLPGAGDRLSRYLLSLIGLGTAGLIGRSHLPEESLIFFSGLLSRQVPSVSAIEATVGYFSGACARVEQFIERVIALDPEDQTRVGVANSELGVSMVCGGYVKENQTKFRVNLGPMSYGHFARFLPSGTYLPRIFWLVRYIVGIEYEFDMRLYLKREEVPVCTVGLGGPIGPRLGWTTWLKTPGTTHEEDPYITFQENDCKDSRVVEQVNG